MPTPFDIISALLMTAATFSAIVISAYAFSRSLRWRVHQKRGAPTEIYDLLSWLIWMGSLLGFISTLVLLIAFVLASNLRFDLSGFSIPLTLYMIAAVTMFLAVAFLLIGITIAKQKEELTVCLLRQILPW